MCHHAQLIFIFFGRDTISPCCLAGLKLVTLSDLPASGSQSAGITGVSHCIQTTFCFCVCQLGGGVGVSDLEAESAHIRPSSDLRATESRNALGGGFYSRWGLAAWTPSCLISLSAKWRLEAIHCFLSVFQSSLY